MERGNACILRSERIGQFDRSLSVTCEIINVESGHSKLLQAADGTVNSISGESIEAGDNVISNKNVNSSGKSIRERLEELRELRNQGIITEAEFDAEQKKLLDSNWRMGK